MEKAGWSQFVENLADQILVFRFVPGEIWVLLQIPKQERASTVFASKK